MFATYSNKGKHKTSFYIPKDSIDPIELEKIISDKKRNFDKRVRDFTARLVSDLEKRLKNVKQQERSLIYEKAKVNAILFKKWEVDTTQDICNPPKVNLHLPQPSYNNFKTYVEHYILQGKSFDYSVIPGESSERYDFTIELPEVLAEGFNRYLEVIENKLSGTAEEPFNPYPNIFASGHAFKLFENLKELIVKEESKQSNYGFIYYRLHDPALFAIHEAVTAPIFIRFLDKEINADLCLTKLRNSKSAKDYLIFNSELQNYLKALNRQNEFEYLKKKLS